MPYRTPAYLIRIRKLRRGYSAEVILIKPDSEEVLCGRDDTKGRVFAWAQEQHKALLDLPPDEALPIRYEAPWFRGDKEQWPGWYRPKRFANFPEI